MIERSDAVDAAVAAAFVAWAVAEIATRTVTGPIAITLTAAVSPAALAWRRHTPAVTALVCAAGLVLKTACGLRLDGLALLAAILVAAYSVGRHLPARRAALVTGIMLVAAWLSLFGLDPVDRTVANYPFVALWTCGPAAAGAALRAQLERTAAVADRAARAEMMREQYALAAVVDERARLARELHDTVAHAVSLMVLNAGAVRSRLPEGSAAERAALAAAEDQGRRAITELRQMLGVLRTGGETTEPLPTLARVDELVDESRALGLRIDVEVVGEPVELPAALEVSAYRIIQEALTNVRKHAAASSVAVRLDYAADALSVTVSDDGVGPEIHSRPNGHGLVGIRERVDLHGGTLRTEAGPGGGFVLCARLPMEPA